MISLVAHTINWCVASVCSVLATAALIGQAIVSLLAFLVTGASTVLAFLITVYEDNRRSFCVELPSIVIYAPVAVLGHFQNAADFIYASFVVVLGRCCSFIGLTTSFLNSLYTSLTSVALLIKNAVILVGDSLWLIITFIPVHLPLLLRYVLTYLRNSLVETVLATYALLLRLTNFLTDVPLQSLVGIISLVIIVRLCVDFQDLIISFLTTVYWALVRRLLSHYYAVYNYLTNSEGRIITQMVQEHRLDRQELNVERVDELGETAADALCVICQERQKCVLILPCRHICLCRECCTRLYRYQRTCPICRAYICHSVTVYI